MQKDKKKTTLSRIINIILYKYELTYVGVQYI